MLEKSSVSVIIVSYNTKELLSACLDSIGKFSGENINTEVWVVDNASTDGSAETVRKKYPWVKLIANEKNLGFAKANNQAIRKVNNSYIFLLNPDAQVQKFSWEKMIAYMEKHKDIGILGPMLVGTDGKVQKEISPFPKLLDSILVLIKLHRIKPFSQLVYPNYNYENIQEVDHLMGSALFIRKKIFDVVGLFDENFFLWFEETDFEKRAKEAGWKIVFYPKATVKHLAGQSSRQVSPIKKQTIWNKSLWVYFQKHHSQFDRLMLLPFMLLSYIATTLVYYKKKIWAR